MKRNLAYIIVLMSVALIGIVIFQVYWISNSYDLHNQVFRNEVSSALEKVINQDVEVVTIGDLLDAADTSRMSITIQSHRSVDSLAKDRIFVPRADMERLVSSVLISLASIHPEISSLETDYRKALKERNINTPFLLAFSENGRIFEKTGGDDAAFRNAQAIQGLPGLKMSSEKVLAFFPEYRSYLMNRMWGALIASILLILLTGGSFFYMLVTLLRQKKLSDVKNDFINNMTHELKTPIATVSAAMEAMSGFGALDDRERGLRYVDLSRKELARLTGMVENVLRISTFEKQKITLFKETFDVNQVLEETARNFLLQNPDRVEFSFDLKGPGYIHADKFHIQNVINNLFDNAIKYSPGKAVIDVSCSRTNEFIVFSVRDHGLGISREQQQHIFEKFYRVPTGDLHAVKGFGLGLAYVRQIVEAHGGTVGVKSQSGTGSEFTIALPEIQ